MTSLAASTTGTASRIVTGKPYAPIKEAAHSYTLTDGPRFELELEHGGDVWIVTDVKTGIHGVGESPSDALGDFRSAIREHLAVLESDDSLSEDLVAQLRYLRDRA